MGETLTLTLTPPLKNGVGEVRELVLREPTAGEMRDVAEFLELGTVASRTDYDVALLAAVSGVAAEVLEGLPVSVLRQAKAFLLAFDKDAPPPAPLPGKLPIPLDPDFAFEKTSYGPLELQEPTVGQRRRAETVLVPLNETTARKYPIKLVSEVSGVPYAAVAAMPVSVVNKAAAYLRGFSEGGPQTGSP